MKTISKVPVVHEDIAIGVGKINQQRGANSVEVRQVELSWIFRTTPEIRGLDIAKYSRIQLHQQGAASEYWYDAASIAADDGITVLKPDAIGASATGRWILALDAASGSIPLIGTTIGRPVTGPISFEDSVGNELYTMQTDIVGPDSFGFLSQTSTSSFIIATKNDIDGTQGFSFNERGQMTLPSEDGTNQEGWQLGAGTLFGDSNVFIISPVDALGNITTHSAAILVSPTVGFSFSTDGSMVMPRATVFGDSDLVAVTKGYVDTILPPGGGEANTTSSPGASGEELTMAKVGPDLPFKKLIAGTDITLTATVDGITIDGSGGGGGGLPAGSVNQGLRNLAGTNTYEASAGLLIDVAGNVAVGPSSLAPAVPLQVEGTVLLRSGGQLSFNNPSNSSTGYIINSASNRLNLYSPSAGGIDINGSSSIGSAVAITANGQEVFQARGGVSSWCMLKYSGVEKLATTSTGITITGDLIVNDIAADVIGCDSIGAANLAVNGEVVYVDNDFGILAQAGYQATDVMLLNTAQNVTGAITFDAPSTTVKNLVADAIACDSVGAANLTTVGRVCEVGTFGIVTESAYLVTDFMRKDNVQQITGLKEFNGGATFGNPTTLPSGGASLTVGGSIFLEGAVSGTGIDVVSDFGLLKVKSSDERLKEQIANTGDGLNAVLALRPVQFIWKEGGKFDAGFIAQEVKEIIPEAVHDNPDGMLGLRDTPIIAALVKAVQEQQVQIDELKALLNG